MVAFRGIGLMLPKHVLGIVILLTFQVLSIFCLGEVIFAVNCGGASHTDLNGVHYQADRLLAGTSSDYGKSVSIGRVAPPDQILYQTERYHVADFGYSIPIRDEGDFVLVLKFCEVYFRGSKLKVFDVKLNHLHTVVKDLDLYEKVGYGIAHDEYIPFSIRNGELFVEGQSSPFPGQLYVEFIKTYYDNPKINALVVFRGKVEDVPKLPPLASRDDPNEEREEELEEQIAKPNKPRKKSGPKAEDPYKTDDASLLYPILVAVGVFIPTLFCLCRL